MLEKWTKLIFTQYSKLRNTMQYWTIEMLSIEYNYIDQDVTHFSFMRGEFDFWGILHRKCSALHKCFHARLKSWKTAHFLSIAEPDLIFEANYAHHKHTCDERTCKLASKRTNQWAKKNWYWWWWRWCWRWWWCCCCYWLKIAVNRYRIDSLN